MSAIWEDLELNRKVKVTILANGTECPRLSKERLIDDACAVMAQIETGKQIWIKIQVDSIQCCVVFLIDGIIRRVKPVIGLNKRGHKERFLMKTGFVKYTENGTSRIHFAEFVAAPIDFAKSRQIPGPLNTTSVGLIEVRVFYCGMPQLGGVEGLLHPEPPQHFHDYQSWHDIPGNGEPRYNINPAPRHELRLVPGRAIDDKFSMTNHGVTEPIIFTGAVQFARFIFAYRDGGM